MGLLNWLGLAPAGKSLELGDPAPEVVALDETGNSIQLNVYCREAYTLVYFFPKADTPGCTAQACALRDDFSELTARHVRVVGISADSPAALRRFKSKHRLPFPLLSDEDHKLSQAFGVPTILGMASRQSFLMQDGRLMWRDLKASTRWQARDVLQALDALKARHPS